MCVASVAQLARAPDCGPGGRWFNSSHSPHINLEKDLSDFSYDELDQQIENQDLLKTIKDEKNSYLYFRIGFNKDFCDVSQVNVMKFILEFNEDYVLKHLIDLTLDGSFEKLTDIKPESLDACLDTIKKRMETMQETNDGFVIAEKDLELRGSGEFFGTRQHRTSRI